MKKLRSLIGLLIWCAFIIVAIALIFIKKEETPKIKSAVIIELWQIDSFEGGQGSRRQYLLQIGKAFEKTKKNVLVSVINETVESAEEKFKKGVFPDMISYGIGLEGVYAKAKDLGGIESNFLVKDGSKTLAIAWANGGYVCVKRQNIEKIDKIILSKGTYAQPLLALYAGGFFKENDEDLKKVEIYSPLEAYYAFLSAKNAVLIGTQRDLYRLSKRGFECEIEPIGGFTDLVQYISVTADEKDRQSLCKEFISLLLSKGQEEIFKIGLLPVKDEYINLKNVDNQPIEPLLGVKYDKTLSPFYQKAALKELHLVLCDGKKSLAEKNKYIENALKYLK